MGGYSLEDVPHLSLSDDSQASLTGQDPHQAELMAEAVIAVT